MGVLDPELSFIKVLSDDLIILNPQFQSAAPSHQFKRRCDAMGIFIHLSVSLFLCVVVPTLIARQMYLEGLRESELC